MILSNNGAGIGTSQNKKQRGNRNSRAMRAPKHNTKDPIHQITIAIMLTESCISGGARAREKTPIRIAIINRTEPDPAAGSDPGTHKDRSEKINHALIGTIKSKWVYSSTRSASAKVLNSGRQPTTSDTTHRSANRKDGDILAAVPAPVGMEVITIVTHRPDLSANRGNRRGIALVGAIFNSNASSEVKLHGKLYEARITRALRKSELRSSEFNRLWFFADQAHGLEHRIHMVPDVEEL